ncbi:MAG: Dam family site-specific DNA-(adenine-N6)-methyltransferase [Gammaproteobacteria bacterium]|nr:Dam family site-specific DNA-(adenine-N6)-methyltransferase [Gammaproteobacteria bacterium]
MNGHTFKPFLKWPGGKYRLVTRICKQLDHGKRLVEPFAGSAAVFLNTNYNRYLLADSNPDLINLYRQLQTEGDSFIEFCRDFFSAKKNNEKSFYEYRSDFNHTDDIRLKSALFVYLNRHCYNGLCRYNAKGEFNTPFGRHHRPYFPGKEMQHFFYSASKAEFIHARFSDTMRRVQEGDVVYCDPPYTPLSETAYFTDYFSGGFNWDDQIELAEWAGKLVRRGIQVVISNHNTKSTRDLYQGAGARMKKFKVRRTISCDAENREMVSELLAVFQPV